MIGSKVSACHHDRVKGQLIYTSKLGLCTLCHGLQTSMESILACQPALCTERGPIGWPYRVIYMHTDAIVLKGWLKFSSPARSRARVKLYKDVSQAELIDTNCTI